MNYSYTPSYLGLIATGLLILVFFIFLFYYLLIKKKSFSPKFILTTILLLTIAIGIHSLQHQGQEEKQKKY